MPRKPRRIGTVSVVFAACLASMSLSGVATADPPTDAFATQERDFAETVARVRTSAEQGDADAQLILGVLYAHGMGVQQDYVHSLKWFRKASEQGHVWAKVNIGMLYQRGFGVPQDYVQAHMWFNLAGSSAANAEERNRAVAKRNAVAAMMTPAQVAEAQRLAREWKPVIEEAK